jgi:signal transduction histidine kinase
MAGLAAETAREMRLIAAEKDIQVTVNDDGQAFVEGDPQRLGELLLILLDNAVKYTDPGGAVSVTVQHRDRDIEVAVSDTGRGIPAEALPHVFDRFYRVDRARSREMGGTGLGLAIARWIVEGHGGTIRIESSPGVGTTVSFTIPSHGDIPAPNPWVGAPQETTEPAQAD